MSLSCCVLNYYHILLLFRCCWAQGPFCRSNCKPKRCTLSWPKFWLQVIAKPAGPSPTWPSYMQAQGLPPFRQQAPCSRACSMRAYQARQPAPMFLLRPMAHHALANSPPDQQLLQCIRPVDKLHARRSIAALANRPSTPATKP